jgi:hypothetical protein
VRSDEDCGGKMIEIAGRWVKFDFDRKGFDRVLAKRI